MSISYESICREIVERVLKERVPDGTYEILELVLQGKKYDEISQETGFAFDTVKVYSRRLWSILSKHFSVKVSRFNVRQLLEEYAQSPDLPQSIAPPSPHWPLEMLVVPQNFVGRTAELDLLQQAIASGGLTLVIGQPGIGKTSLVAQQLQDYPKHQIIWQTLDRQSSLLDICEAMQLEGGEDAVGQIVEALRSRSYVLVLDQAEELLTKEGDHRLNPNAYLKEYSAYEQLIKAVIKRGVSSSLILLSQIPFRDVERSRDRGLPVSILRLGGLSAAEVKVLLKQQGLSDRDYEQIHRLYDGHPGCLRDSLQQIVRLYDGDVEAFIKATAYLGRDIKAAYQQNFERLSATETAILQLLEEPLSFPELVQQVNQAKMNLSRNQVIEALEVLEQMQFVQSSGAPKIFKMNAVASRCLK